MTCQARGRSLHLPQALISLTFFLVLVLSGCAVGPEFHAPTPPSGKTYTRHPLPEIVEQTASPGRLRQEFRVGEDIPGQWWQLFHSRELNRIVDLALKANPDLHAAEASLLQAMENLSAGKGAFAPSATGSIQTVQQYFNGAAFGVPALSSLFTLNTGSVSVSYPLDIFGGVRRQVESLKALADYQKFELEAAYLTLTSNIVYAAISEASLRSQIRATQNIINVLTQEMASINRQFSVGFVSRSTVLQQETILNQARATLPPLEKQLSLVHHQMAVYLGRFPGESSGRDFRLKDLTLPGDLPLSLPSRLVEHRPDIQAAQATLHSANAQVGVSTANMLPQVTLTGQYGSESISGYFSPGSQFWNYGPGLNVPIFQLGTLYFQRKAAIAALRQAKAKYESTVLAAFQNVADTLRTLESDAETLDAQESVFRSAREGLGIARRQFADGAIGYPSLYNAEQSYEQAKIGLVQARAARFSDTAALFLSLGGGWWNMAPATPRHVGVVKLASQTGGTPPAIAPRSSGATPPTPVRP